MTKQIFGKIAELLSGFPSLYPDKTTPQNRTTYRIGSKRRQCIEIKTQNICVLVRFTAPAKQFINPTVPIRDLSLNANFKQWKSEVKFRSIEEVDNAKAIFQSAYTYAMNDK